MTSELRVDNGSVLKITFKVTLTSLFNRLRLKNMFIFPPSERIFEGGYAMVWSLEREKKNMSIIGSSEV